MKKKLYNSLLINFKQTVLLLFLLMTNVFAHAAKCPNGISITTGSPQTLCEGNVYQMVATTTTTGNGNTNIVYQWYFNPTNSTTNGTPVGTATSTTTGTLTNTITIPTTLLDTGTRYYFCKVTGEGTCANDSFFTGTIKVVLNARPVVSTPTANPTSFCHGSTTALNVSAVAGDGGATLNYAWSANSGLAGNVSSGNGTSTVDGPNVFTVTVSNVSNCTTSASVNVTVTANNSITLSSGANTNNQTRCTGTAMTPITFTTTGATGATFSGLPAGVTGAWASNVVTISGTPTATGSYTVTLTGGCGGGTATGTITATPNNTITLSSGANTNNQTRCTGTAMTPITFTTTGATGATFSGLPAGVTGAWASNVVTISGTPTATGSYTVTLTGGCGGGTATGTITATANNSITLSSGANTNNQTRCTGTAMTPITFTTTGATGATFSGLPAGVAGAWASNVVTISGTPTATGSYTVTLTGGCGGGTATGTISVTANNSITLSSGANTNNQTRCTGTPITPITFTTTGATGATFSGLPAGVTGAWASNVVTISGTPTSSIGSPFNYTVTLTGGCGGVTASGSIIVNPGPTASFTINDDKQCQTGNSFVFTSTSTVTGPSQITNLSWNFDTLVPSTGSGSPKTVTFTNKGVVPVVLTVTTDSGCVTSSSSQTITIFPMPDSSFTFPGTICQKDAVTFTQANNSTFTKTWDWGDLTSPQTVNTPTVLHTFQTYSQTTYAVILTVTSNAANGSCTTTKTQNVTVYPLPNVNFTINDDKQCLHSNAFTFTDASTIYTTSGSQLQTYSWNYGDDSLGNGQVVSHSYLVDGLKNVKHSVVSDKGCSHDTTIKVTVDMSPIITITTPPTTICGGEVSTLTTSAFGVNNPTYLWSYNSQITPNIAIVGSISATATSGVTTNYSVTVTDINQCTGSANQDITVKPAPVGPVIDYNRTVPFCIGAIGRQFYVPNFQTSNNITYSWSAPQAARISGVDKQYCNIDSPISATAPFHVIVTASNNFGCSRSADSIISISGSVAPKAEVMRDGSTNTLICMTNTPKSYQWGYDTITTLKESEVPGETYQDFLVGSNPDSSISKRHYWVRITDDGGCQSKIYYQKPYRQSSIREKETTISVSPNPFEKSVNITLENFIDPTTTYEVFDIQGRLLKQQTEDIGSGIITVNTTDWQSGLYILKLQVGSTLNKTIRIVKQ